MLQKIRNAARNAEIAAKLKKSIKMQILLVASAMLVMIVLIFAMTVAWYTNVSRMEGLSFETEAWGFNPEKITIGEENGKVGVFPGKTGIVPLAVDNSLESDDVRAIITVDKSEMSEEYQKRLYFYVDESRTAGEEPASWLSVGKDNIFSYSYTVPAGDILTLSENYSSDVPIRWKWVYTLTGYYFKGKVTENEVDVSEYIRPIEYDIDSAVFADPVDPAMLEEGQEPPERVLLQVGEKTTDEFLTELFESDGFKNEEQLETVFSGEKTYYKVYADENGEGIWAYLCTLEEINAANEFDSAAADAQTEGLTAKVIITAFPINTIKTDIYDKAALIEALASDEQVSLVLHNNFELGEMLALSGENTLDLNGYSLDYVGTESEYSLFDVAEGASLKIINGSISGNGEGSAVSGVTSSACVTSEGGIVRMSGVAVTGFDTVVFADDSKCEADSDIRIVKCDLTSKETCIVFYGNGTLTDGLSRITVSDCSIVSGYIGISGNGTSKAGDERWGTELVINNSTVEGAWTALYQPQQRAKTTITSSVLTGYTGIAVKGGTVDVYSSEINGTGEKTPARNASSGWTDTGDAVYVEAGYDWSAGVFLRGEDNVLSSEYGYLIQLFGVDGKGPGKLIDERSETYSDNEFNWNGIGMLQIAMPAEEGPVEP